MTRCVQSQSAVAARDQTTSGTAHDWFGLVGGGFALEVCKWFCWMLGEREMPHFGESCSLPLDDLDNLAVLSVERDRVAAKPKTQTQSPLTPPAKAIANHPTYNLVGRLALLISHMSHRTLSL